MKLENVVGLVGSLAALAGCFIPIASRGALNLGIGEAGTLAMVLYACAGIGLVVSLLGLIGKMRKEEYFQVLAGVAGLVVTWLVQRHLAGASWAFGLHLLYWGFAMLMVEGLINFRDHRPGIASAA